MIQGNFLCRWGVAQDNIFGNSGLAAWCSITCNAGGHRIEQILHFCIAAIVAQSSIEFYFSPRLRQQIRKPDRVSQSLLLLFCGLGDRAQFIVDYLVPREKYS